MPLILVVEQEQRYVERISQALSSHGWEVEGVHDRASALQFVAGQSASLVVVNSQVPESGELIKYFSRRTGGPGTVVLIPENADDGATELGADEVLQKPFTDQDIRLAVRRCLIGAPGAARATEGASGPAPAGTTSATEEPIVEQSVSEQDGVDKANGKVVASASAAEDAGGGADVGEVAAGRPLTSEDIFGDVVSELESALAAGRVDGSEAAEVAEPLAAPEAAAAEPAAEEAPAEAAAVDEPVVEEPISEERAAAQPVEEDESPVEAAVEEEAVKDIMSVEEAEEVVAPAASVAETARPEPVPESAELAAADEAEAVVEQQAEAPVAAAADEASTPREGAAQPEPAAAKPPPVDPAALLNARIRQAAEEGKRLAEEKAASSPAEVDASVSADELLRRALSGLEPPKARPEPAETETAAETGADEVVSSMVEEPALETEGEGPEAAVGANEPDAEVSQPEREAAVSEPETEAEVSGEREALEPLEAGLFDSEDIFHVDEAAVLEVTEATDKGPYQARLKLMWAIIIIVLLAVLAFIFARQAGDGSPGAAAERSTIVPAEDAAAGEESESAAAGGSVDGEPGGEASEAEGELRRELEAQRRQLQEEISKSQSSDGGGG